MMGKLNFRGYLISRFYPTCEIRENLMHAKNVFYGNNVLATTQSYQDSLAMDNLCNVYHLCQSYAWARRRASQFKIFEY